MSAGEKKLHEVLEPDAEVIPGKMMTAVMVDGNSIAAVAGVFRDSILHIHHVYHVELDRLVELTRRLKHPIFMNVNLSQFVEPDLLRDRLRDIFLRKEFQNPTFVLFAPDKVRVEELVGSTSDAERSRRAAALLRSSLPFNPIEFPAVVELTEEPLSDGRSVTRLTTARLSDLLPIVRLVREAGGRVVGMVTSHGASAKIGNCLTSVRNSKPTILCDVGKLRTIYTTMVPNQRCTYFPIPVGLARDDGHYFKSIELSSEKLLRMQQTVGTLLFPPETTPSPLFSGYVSSPQIDCTRFAIQISRYAQRCIEELPKTELGERPETIHYLTGRASRLPGLRGYMEARLHRSVRRLDRRPLRGVELQEGISWGDVADNLLPIGALLEVGISKGSSSSLMKGQLQAPPIQGNRCSIEKFQPNKMYLFEQKVEMV